MKVESGSFQVQMKMQSYHCVLKTCMTSYMNNAEKK